MAKSKTLKYFLGKQVAVHLDQTQVETDVEGNTREGNRMYVGILLDADIDYVYLGARIDEDTYEITDEFPRSRIICIYKQEDSEAEQLSKDTGVN